MNIYESIPKIMSEIGAIGKEKTNKQQDYKYRGVDDVMNALQPFLVKYKVFIVPEVLKASREDRTSSKGNALIYSVCEIKYTFFAEDGTSFTAIVVGEGMDSGDKATNKAMAIAFKYVCFQVFCIPTEEMTDPDGDSHDLKPQNPPQQAKLTGNENSKPKDTPKNDSVQPSDTEKRAAAIYFTMTGDKKGQLGWPVEEYKKWLKGFKEVGSISTDYGKKWTVDDLEFLEARVAELEPPF